MPQGTVGGFGVGSDFAWTATGRVDYRITRAISLVAGYHVMEYEFDDRGSGENFDVDIQLHGPFLGVAFTF